MPLNLTEDKSTMVQVMAWCCQATSHYLSQCWPRFISPNGITRPQYWINWMENGWTTHKRHRSVLHPCKETLGCLMSVFRKTINIVWCTLCVKKNVVLCFAIWIYDSKVVQHSCGLVDFFLQTWLDSSQKPPVSVAGFYSPTMTWLKPASCVSFIADQAMIQWGNKLQVLVVLKCIRSISGTIDVYGVRWGRIARDHS